MKKTWVHLGQFSFSQVRDFCFLNNCVIFFRVNLRSRVLLPETSFGLRVLLLPASVCPSICPCVNHKLVCTITLDPFKLGSPSLDQRCKTPWLRSLFFLGGMIDCDLQGEISLISQILPNSELWICQRDNSSPVQARITEFGPEVQSNLVKIPIIMGTIPRPFYSPDYFTTLTLCTYTDLGSPG